MTTTTATPSVCSSTRAAAGGVAGSFSDDELPTVRAICQRLDGMALAIELAAARVASFGVDGVMRALDDSHQFLSVGHATHERHRSLRAAIDWSYHLLDDDEQRLLRAVSVFAAPFDLDAAATIAGRPAGASCSTCSAGSSTGTWSAFGRAVRPGIGCSRRSASTPTSDPSNSVSTSRFATHI